MPEPANQLSPPANSHGEDEVDADRLRLLSRSPHPYRRQTFELHPEDRLTTVELLSIPTQKPRGSRDPPLLSYPPLLREPTSTSDSGTEADDEHFLKGLPAPKARLHKGLRGKNEALSGTSTPLLSPALLEEEGRKIPTVLKKDAFEIDKWVNVEKSRRRKEVVRRATELLILISLGGILLSNPDVKRLVKLWRKEYIAQLGILTSLLLVYPLRLIVWAYQHRTPSSWIPIAFPVTFDPAPVLYPPIIPLLVSLLVSTNTAWAILPNLVLSICAIPKALIPAAQSDEVYSLVHWALSCIPIFLSENDPSIGLSADSTRPLITPETATLLHPLHQTLCEVLHHLMTTSLLPAELQLLSIALIDLLLLSTSPQAVILNAILWGGGLGILASCGPVIRWGITLARVPRWRFRRPPLVLKRQSRLKALLISLFPARRAKHELFGSAAEDSAETGHSSDDQDSYRVSLDPTAEARLGQVSSEDTPEIRFAPVSSAKERPSRRSTSPSNSGVRSKTHTPSGRRKRSASSSVAAFFSMTQAEAAQRRWIYAGYVYACVLAIVFIGVREYISRFALGGLEPVGWALGYMFGNLPWFRFQVVKADLERWICLPPRFYDEATQSCYLGWVEHVRQASLGSANTRLVLSAYWLTVVVLGLAVVFQLSPIYEVDTRRKVFHFMMVAMFLPATFVDPTYAALALSLVLGTFLLLDLLRASQLPPLSKPIASFLTPYVDGRDLRGPVVISHIFLLIGCAIPLWLSLAALPRTGSGYLAGWEVPSRDVSMVSGVVCVGLGDAAASLIGRRWGYRKWFWGGGKSLEGSIAFAIAVFLGLMASALWLRIGNWPVTGEAVSGIWAWNWARSARNAGMCASIASLTEAVLTGGNDNVVVPIVLWTCVQGLGV